MPPARRRPPPSSGRANKRRTGRVQLPGHPVPTRPSRVPMDPADLPLRSKELRELFALFPPGDDMPEYEFVPGDEVPPPYHDLLVHEQHMTVTVERHHGDRVDVAPLA